MKYIYIPDIKLKKAVNEELVKLLGKREMLQDITDDEILNITSLYIDSCGINEEFIGQATYRMNFKTTTVQVKKLL